MKISILGYSGSGKTTLAKKLGEALNLPIFHLDRIHFRGEWQPKDYQSILEEIQDILALDHWILEGNYSDYLFTQRLEDSDLILYLRFNRFLCFHRALKRYLMYRGETRDELPSGCKEKFDQEFMWWILHKQRSRRKRQAMKKKLEPYQDKLIYLRNPRQVEHYLKHLRRGKS